MNRLLLIDAGNTRLKWARARPHRSTSDEIRDFGDMATRAVTFQKIKALAKQYPTDGVVLACVVPKFLPFFRRAFGKRLFNVTGDAPKLGLPFDYPNPAEIGADRLASAVAAHALRKWPVIIINCGTATAFTVLNEKGALCGGAIAPGLQVQLRVLLGATAQLPETDLRPPRRGFLARNTHDAIRSGVLLSFQGGVQETITQLGQALMSRRRPHVILTGGNAPLLAKSITAHGHPLLVFEGLRIIGTRVFFPLAT
jgi:type III pantothenate kinase